MVIEGVDYSVSHPSPAALVAAGKHFACRYGGPGGSNKQLTASELASLKAHDIAVVANAEGVAQGFKGFSAGKAWALDAEAHFTGLGMPKDRPIYFSVDWKARSSDWPEIDAACKGAASVIGADRVGVYGGYYTIAHCVSAGIAHWFWQTYAWSRDANGNLQWHPKAHIQQYHNEVSIGGADCDLDRAMVEDYGQWGVDMPLSDGDIAKITAIVNSTVKAQLDAAFAAYSTGWSKGYPGRTDDMHKDDMQTMRNFLNGSPDKDTTGKPLGQQVPTDAPVARLVKAADLIIADHAVHTS